ncbi:efflux RND transporter periplasmic adaptor subunit [Halopseudomonas pelagia]|uniref:efflux RND transporter periplasmic adaptor subunit n=1 Tax=Halopseudomonas pelagia TaxID=553151 RepID=UPI000399CCE2|nr:efflux RND transporter periplasmic adaptor subunit [Halopseudomonas pelagia]
MLMPRPVSFRSFPCLFILGLFLLALLAGCQQEAPPASAERPPTPVAAYEVSTRDLSRPLRIAATVEPRTLISLAARTAGTVQSVAVEEGDRVKAGQLLAQLDVAEAVAELARAQAQMASATLDFNRAIELRRRGVATEIEYQAADVALQVTRSQRELWQSRVAYGRIEAPQASMVIARYIETGEAVETQSTLFELADMDQLVLRLGVSELDVVHLQQGQLLPITLDALPELRLEGIVRRIFPAALGSSRLITVEVLLPTTAWDQGVRPGFLARIDAAIDPRPDTLVVPSAALGSQEGGYYLFVIEHDILVRRTVTTGISRSRWTEILSGVEPGELILASNPIDMLDEQKVRIVIRHD